MSAEYFADMRRFYGEQPHEVSIETLALCNARCTFCPYPTLDRKGTALPDEVLHRLIDEMGTFVHPFYFSPFKVNEPLLDKRLIPLCRRFNEKAPQGVLRIFSNGSALVERSIREIATLDRVAHLWVSLNEHTAEAYEATMGLDFATTLRRLDRLHEIVRAKEFPHPVMVSRVGMDPAFVHFVNTRWPLFGVATIKKDAWIDFTDATNPEVPDTPCGRWWELNITATGKAALCCMDGEARFGFGDVTTQTLLEIYNNPTLKAWRENTASRLTVGDPCNRCSY